MHPALHDTSIISVEKIVSSLSIHQSSVHRAGCRANDLKTAPGWPAAMKQHNSKDMTYSDDFVISSMDELIELIYDLGFVPFSRMRSGDFPWRSILTLNAGMAAEISGMPGNGKDL